MQALKSQLLGCVDSLYFLASKLSALHASAQFFSDGWGDVDETIRIKKVLDDEILPAMLHPESDAPALAEPVIEELASQAAAAPKRTPGQVTSWDASFTSPAAGWIPACSKQAHIRVLLPPADVPLQGTAVMLPATGDMGYGVRTKLYAQRLAQQGVVGIMLIAPLYGTRKAANQHKWFLRDVHSLAVQAPALALEAACLLHWARGQFAGPLAVTGISYGGAMAALASKMYARDVAVVPYMGCNGPGWTFVYGVIRFSVAWRVLRKGGAPAVPEAYRPAADRDTFEERCRCYLDYVTDVSDWLPKLVPVGARVVHCLQCKHDRFVNFEGGAEMFETLKHSVDCAPPPNAGAPSTRVARFSTLPGGHVWGFLQAPRVLTAAVLAALAEMRGSSASASPSTSLSSAT